MNKDPYQILGVSRNATDDEIKKAYRELAKKYHPDNYSDSPLADLAEEKMKEINEAYDIIQKNRASGASGNSKQDYSSYTYSGITSFEEVRRLIAAGKYTEAELIIDSTPASDRGAEWNYLKCCLLVNRGYFYDAQKYIETACYLDPNNVEYRNVKEKLRYQAGSFGGNYRQQGTYVQPDCCSDCCSTCATYLCIDAFCDCCGGGC